MLRRITGDACPELLGLCLCTCRACLVVGFCARSVVRRSRISGPGACEAFTGREPLLDVERPPLWSLERSCGERDWDIVGQLRVEQAGSRDPCRASRSWGLLWGDVIMNCDGLRLVLASVALCILHHTCCDRGSERMREVGSGCFTLSVCSSGIGGCVPGSCCAYGLCEASGDVWGLLGWCARKSGPCGAMGV